MVHCCGYVPAIYTELELKRKNYDVKRRDTERHV